MQIDRFIKNWFDKSAVFVLNLFKKVGNFYSYTECISIFGVDTSPRVGGLLTVFHLNCLVRSYCSYWVSNCEMPKSSIGGLELLMLNVTIFGLDESLLGRSAVIPKHF